jgi:uncharacterized membrane protein YjjP (DUF1212 family)
MENTIKSPKNIKANEVAEFILDAGVFLMASGAHSGRVWRNCRRIAEHWGYRMNFNPTFTGIMVSVWDDKNRENAVTRYKTAPANIVHLETLTQISHLSWKIADNEIEYDDACLELEAIKHKAHYPFWLVALAVGISCGCLCTLAGGSPIDAALAFCGASVGSIARHFILKKQFNQFLSIIIASAITTLIAGTDTIFGLGRAPEMTLATSVLYLIPGVPLINSVIDLLEGYFSASIARSLFAASIVSSIAVGMILSITLLGINNF